VIFVEKISGLLQSEQCEKREQSCYKEKWLQIIENVQFLFECGLVRAYTKLVRQYLVGD